jgi:hypothetical protein
MATAAESTHAATRALDFMAAYPENIAAHQWDDVFFTLLAVVKRVTARSSGSQSSSEEELMHVIEPVRSVYVECAKRVDSDQIATIVGALAALYQNGSRKRTSMYRRDTRRCSRRDRPHG